MKNAFKLPMVTTLVAALTALPVVGAHAGPMGPSAKMAARLKKRPTSTWLAHYLPDDRYKIAGGVWKYVSTDLDTFYHRPDSPLMLRQPAGRVIGFSSTQEAEEAGYQPGPSVKQAAGPMDFMGGMTKAVPRPGGQSPQILSAMREIQTLAQQMQSDRSGNFPLMRQRLQRIVTLLDTIPVKPSEQQSANQIKGGMRGLLRAMDLVSAGDTAAARRQLSVSLAALRSGTSRRRR